MKEKIIVIPDNGLSDAENRYSLAKYQYDKMRKDFPDLVPFEENPFYYHDLADFA